MRHCLQLVSLLKIAADHYPDVRILATGSSTLGASAKFKDTLTGRKESLWLTPMLAQDLVDFGDVDLAKRLLFGGNAAILSICDIPGAEFPGLGGRLLGERYSRAFSSGTPSRLSAVFRAAYGAERRHF